MKIQYLSDIHLEYEMNNIYMDKNPIIVCSDILIIAGDLMPFYYIDFPRINKFLDYISSNFKIVYWIPGNHEYYNDIHDFNKMFIEPIYKKIRDNVILINNKSILIDDIEFIFSTMWSYIPVIDGIAIRKQLNDYFLIRNEYNKKITIDDTNMIFKSNINYLTNLINNKNRQVVITHHVPTFLNWPELYKTSELNYAFGVELYDLIEESNIKVWIYGHHHVNVHDFNIGNTKLITNQLGNLNSDFVHNKTIDIN